jgi:hypothetical protein
VPPEVREVLDDHLELYKVAVDEYRFQVNLNASRTGQLLLLNVAVIAAVAAILRLGDRPAEIIGGALLIVGAVAAIASALASDRQHQYYRRARNRVKEIEKALGIEPPFALETTFTMAGQERPRGWWPPRTSLAVRELLEAIFVAIALADLAVAVYLFQR